MSISAMKQALEALEKLANETPTTHVRAGKAQIDGKEFVALWFDDCSDPIQQATYINATKPSRLKEFLSQVREHLSQAIAEAEKQEPLCWVYNMNDLIHDLKTINYGTVYGQPVEGMTPLYTAPPKREWVGLTDEEIYDYADKFLYQHGSNYGIRSFGKAVEAKLKEKNT
jgi:hypothetical protein